MAGSLKDQLLKAGLTDKKRANKAAEQQRQSAKKAKNARKAGQQLEDERKQALEKARLEKLEKDRELNRQREAEKEQKSRLAQIKQWIEQNRIEIPAKAETAYNFVVDRKIKKLYVTDEQLNQLARGHIAIAPVGESFALIPDVIAERIEMVDANAVIRITPEEAPDEDDPYADYQIPDDLMW